MGTGSLRGRGRTRHGLRYVAGALILLACLALRGEPSAITFVHPKAHLVLAGPYGTEIPVQTKIRPDARNRYWSLAWQGAGCAGSSLRSLDGDRSAAIQPEDRPLNVRVGAGTCYFVAAVIGQGGAVLGRGEFELEVR